MAVRKRPQTACSAHFVADKLRSCAQKAVLLRRIFECFNLPSL